MKYDGISVVSPMWGPLSVTNRMVFSVIHQFISKNNPFNIELVLVDDYLEERGPNGESPYDIYVSEEFKKFYDPELISIKLIKNEEHKYQGESREIGFLAAKYDWFVLIDCDDIMAANTCDRYLCLMDRFFMDQEQVNPAERKDLACINGLTYGFDTYGNENPIPGHSIWVQGRCYNRNFIKKYDIHFPTGTNSRQAEDYPFMRKFDYVAAHAHEYAAIKIPYGEGKDCQCTCFWFPNENSLSRQDPHYGQHLAGWTMNSSNEIIDFCDDFNEKYGFVDQEDEAMKHEYLNMNVYAFYNLLDFLREVSMTDWEPKEEDWYALRDAVCKLRKRLKEKFWEELVTSDVEDMLFTVHHHSDVRFTESWIGTFFDYMNFPVEVTIEKFDDVDKEIVDIGKTFNIFEMSYDQMLNYCHSIKFDGAGHEVHSSQVMAWLKRHPDFDKKLEKIDSDKKADRTKSKEAIKNLSKNVQDILNAKI